MLGIHHFALFLTTGILLNLTPGPDTAYILGRSIAQGRSAGIASALGITVGSIVSHNGRVLAKRLPAPPPLPLCLPSDSDWLLKIVAIQDRFVLVADVFHLPAIARQD